MFKDKTQALAGATAIFLITIGIVQIVLGETYSKSVALTANGVDCVGDGFVSGVVWVGLSFFRKPADQKFHFGYYKLENLASVAAAIVMVILAGYIAFRSYEQLIDPHEVKVPLLGAGIAMFAAIVAVGIGTYKFMKERKGNLKSAKLEAFNTIKDGTASFLAVVALILSWAGFTIADAIIGFIIALIIVSIAFMAIREASLVLIDACDKACIDMRMVILNIANDHPKVKGARIARLRQSGPFYMGELDIEVDEDMTIKEIEKIKKELHKQLKKDIADIDRLTIIAMASDGEHER